MIPDPIESTESLPVDSAPHRPRRLGRRISFARPGRGFAALATVVVLFYGVAGYLGSADMFGDHPRWRGMNRGPADFGLRSETVSFDAIDGIPLKAWRLPASGMPRGAVIIAHGIDHTRQVMLPRAAFLVRGGYDVLAMDLRGHGESGGRIVSPGVLEARDILGALRYIRSRGDNEPVAALGVSSGAVASLIASAESPEIAAVIADGAYPTGKDVSEDISRHYLHDPRTNFWLRAVFMASSFPGVGRATALAYYFRSGIYLGPELLSVIPSASRIRVPVLLISGERDWIVPTDKARQILSVIRGDRKELVVIPNALHDTTYSAAPTVYASTVLNFLDRSILEIKGQPAYCGTEVEGIDRSNHQSNVGIALTPKCASDCSVPPGCRARTSGKAAFDLEAK